MLDEKIFDWAYYKDRTILFSVLETLPHDHTLNMKSPTLLPYLYLAAYQQPLFLQYLQQINYDELSEIERLKYVYLHTSKLRFANNRQQALEYLQQALTSTSIEHPYYTDVYERLLMLEFALYTELGDLYKSLERMNHFVQSYPNSPKVNSVKSNEVFVLTDLGQIEVLKTKISTITESCQDLFKLSIESYEGKLNLARKWLEFGYP